MSDPNRPASEEMTDRQKALEVCPSAHFEAGRVYKEFTEKGRRLHLLRDRLNKLDLTPLVSVKLNKMLHSKESIRIRSTDVLAACEAGPGIHRLRSETGKMFTNAGYAELPETHPFASQETVGERCRNTIKVEAPGAEMCIGRLERYHPRPGDSPLHPFTREEADRALIDAGVCLNCVDAAVLKPFPLIAKEEGERGVKVSRNSSNGLPTQGSSSDPDDMERVRRIAVTMEKKLADAQRAGGREAVRRLIKEWKAGRPLLMTLMGRAKADCYDVNKVNAMQLRFYTVWPRWMQLIISRAFQPLSQLAYTILDEEFASHALAGTCLAYGGAEKVVAALQAQLDAEDFAFVVQGDDSWVIIKHEGGLWMFDLDCSSFDITQHNATTEHMHAALEGEIARIVDYIATLWYEMMRERSIVMTSTLTYDEKHCGPSGGQGQDKINSMLMSSAIRRTLSYFSCGAVGDHLRGERAMPAYARLKEALARVGREVGFTIRLGQFVDSSATTIKEALAETPFLFVGYYFHVLNGKVAPCCDVARTLAQASYPSGPFMKDKNLFLTLDAMRIGGVCMSMGIPPPELQGCFTAMRSEALFRLREQINKVQDFNAEGYTNYLMDSPFGIPPELTLLGQYRALLRDPYELWMVERPSKTSPPAENPFDSPIPGQVESWGDQTSREELEVYELFGVTPPPPGPVPRPYNLDQIVPGTNPFRGVTIANQGRPPPTSQTREGAAPARPRLAPARSRGAPRGSIAGFAEEDDEGEYPDPEPDAESEDEYAEFYADPDRSQWDEERGRRRSDDEDTRSQRHESLDSQEAVDFHNEQVNAARRAAANPFESL